MKFHIILSKISYNIFHEISYEIPYELIEIHHDKLRLIDDIVMFALVCSIEPSTARGVKITGLCHSLCYWLEPAGGN